MAPGDISGALKGAARLSLFEGLAHHQLVGGVTAHQGLRLAGLRGWPAALGLRYCPDSYGRLQSRIIRNGGNPANKLMVREPLEEGEPCGPL